MFANDILKNNQTFAVIGVSPDPEKYSYRIFKRLLENGYQTYGISPRYENIDGIPIYPDLSSVPAKIEVAVFVFISMIGDTFFTQCLEAGVQYLWMQPGTYDDALIDTLSQSQIPYVLDCILQRCPEK